MKNIFSKATLAALSLCALWALDASAQFGGMGGGRRGMSQDRSARAAPATPVERGGNGSLLDQASAQLSELQLDLKLNPTQVPAWQLFAQSMNVYLDDFRRGPVPAPVAASIPLSGMLAIRQVVDGVRNRYGLLEDFESQARALYTSLDGSQKSAFDARVSQWRFLQSRAD